MRNKALIIGAAIFGLTAITHADLVSSPVYNPATAIQAQTGNQLVNTTNGTLITPTINNPTVSGQTNSDLTASLPVFTDANKALASKSIANTKLALGLQAGTVVGTTDGTVTNTFPTAFSSAPTVVLTPFNSAAGGTNNVVMTTTTTTFTAKILNGVTNFWVAIGPP